MSEAEESELGTRLRERLAALAQAEEVGSLSPEQEAAVLAARAQSLARTSMEDAAVQVRLVRLHLGERSFALEAELVHSVVRAPRVTPSPVPAPVEGLLSWQGEVLPVISLSAFLGGPATGRSGPVLIVGRGAPELALRVSAADEVTELSKDALRPAPRDPSQLLALLNGALADGTLLLSGQALLEDPRLFF